MRRTPSPRLRLAAAADHVDPHIGCDGHLPPLLPTGIYQAVGTGKWELRTIFTTTKLYVGWIVLVPDPNAEGGFRRENLTRYYRVRRTAGRRFKAGTRSHYFRDWVLVTNRRPTSREPMSPVVFDGVLCLVKVRDVEHDHEQHPIAPAARYSTIGHLVEVQAGGAAR